MAKLSYQFAKTAFAKCTSQNALAFLFSLCGSLLVLISTAPHGIGLTPDSVTYISVARSLSAGNGLTLYDSTPLALYPPIYPVALSLVELTTGLDPVEGARILNALLFGLIICLSGIFFRRHLVSPSFVLVGLASVTLSPVLFERSVFALSEPLFILWTLIFLLLLETYLKKRSFKLLLLLAVFAGLASLTRYIGLSCAVTGAAAILFLLKSPLRTRLNHFIFFGTISILPLCAWAGRNYLLSDALLGPRSPSNSSVAHSLSRALVYFFNWFFPIEFVADRVESTYTLLFLAAVSGYLIGVLWSPESIVKEVKTAFRRIGPSMLFAGIFTAMFVAITSLIYVEGIGDRYLSPVFVPTVLTLLFLLRQSTVGAKRNFSFRFLGFPGSLSKANLVIAFLVAWLVLPSFRVAMISNQLMRIGLDYSQVSWRESETLAFARAHLLPQADNLLIYSNHPDVIYIYTGESVSSSPNAPEHTSSEPGKPVASILDAWPPSPSAHLVWFDNTHRTYLLDPEELQQIASLELVARLSDGAIYKVAAK